MSQKRVLGALAVGALLVVAYFVSGKIFGEPEPEVVVADESAVVEDASAADAPREVPLTGAARIIDQMNVAIAFHQRRGEANGTWLDFGHVAVYELRLARIGGRMEHYGRAERAIERGFEVADEGTGPVIEAMSVAFTLHKFAAVDEYLERLHGGIVLRDRELLIESMGADLHLARGEYEEAQEAIDALVAHDPSVTNLTRLGFYRAQTGQPALADEAFARAIAAARVDQDFHTASLELQRGLLDLHHERYAEARAHYALANEAFPGWYLVEEHLAEVLCELDECERAAAIYADVVERTESPELMGAYADTLEKLGRAEEAAPWHARADAVYDELIERYPEALSGHGLEHFLERAAPERALELARRNIELRADGQARTLLALALLGTRDVAEAESTIAEILASRYRTPELFEVAAEVATRAGHPREAARHLETRREMIAEFAAPPTGGDARLSGPAL